VIAGLNHPKRFLRFCADGSRRARYLTASQFFVTSAGRKNRQDADKHLMPDLTAVYTRSLERLITDQTAWVAYGAAFRGAFIPKRNGGIDA
jgi:hypothetical protein